MFLVLGTKFGLGQRSPFLTKNDLGHSKEELIKLTFGTSSKSLAIKSYLVEKLDSLLKDTLEFSEQNLKWAFNYFYEKEMFLAADQYQNSGWNQKTEKIEYIPGVDYKGLIWFVKIG